MKTEKSYFVMLRGQRGHLIPLLDENDEAMLMFETMAEAEAAAEETTFGETFGFEVFLDGNGE